MATKAVLLQDPRGSRWDGVIVTPQSECTSLERSIGPGEIGVFQPTGLTVTVTITEEFRTGPKDKDVTAEIWRRTHTRLVKVHPPSPYPREVIPTTVL